VSEGHLLAVEGRGEVRTLTESEERYSLSVEHIGKDGSRHKRK